MGRLGHFLLGLATVLVLDALALMLFFSISGMTLSALLAGPQERATKAAFDRAIGSFHTARRTTGDGVTLLGPTRAYGDYLCFARAMTIIPNASNPADPVGPDTAVSIGDLFVLRRQPGSPPDSPNAATAACVKRGDFSHAIAGDAPTVDRAVSMMVLAQEQARKGMLNVAPDCRDLRQGVSRACSSAAILTALDFSSLKRVQGLADQAPGQPTDGATDDLIFATPSARCKAPDLTFVRLVSRWPVGQNDKAGIIALRIRVAGGC